jgi:SNF2 family DNA or RNA helicase
MTPREYTPHPYQKLIGSHEAEHKRGGVWAAMGTGKTVSTLTAVDGLQFAGEMPEPFLVLAPKLVAEKTWPKEAAKWRHLCHMEIQPIVGDLGQRQRALRNTNAAGFTVNYEQIPWLVETLGERWPFKMVVADEATRLKSFRLGGSGGQRARAIAKIAHKHIDRWVNLTGTPSPNGLHDLWGQTWFLDAGQRLGRTFGAFEQRWFRQGYNGYGLEPLPSAQEQIEDAVRDLHLTIGPEWLGVDKPIENVIRVDLPPKARALYRDMEKQMFMSLAGHEVEAFSAAARTIKCLQLANGAAYVDDAGNWHEVHDAKLRALESVVEEAGGAPVLVAYHFKSDLARLQRAFPHAINVGTSEGLDRALKGEGRVWLGHPESMGHGVDGLQEHCNTLAIFGHWWSLESYQQIVERIGPTRQKQSGKNRPVFIHHLVAADTVDELVVARRESKRSVQDLLLEAMKGARYV